LTGYGAAQHTYFTPAAGTNDLDHLLIAHEIPLMKVVEVIQEELHISCLFGQNQAALLLCYV
jgi:hypothetical protein